MIDSSMSRGLDVSFGVIAGSTVMKRFGSLKDNWELVSSPHGWSTAAELGIYRNSLLYGCHTIKFKSNDMQSRHTLHDSSLCYSLFPYFTIFIGYCIACVLFCTVLLCVLFVTQGLICELKFHS